MHFARSASEIFWIFAYTPKYRPPGECMYVYLSFSGSFRPVVDFPTPGPLTPRGQDLKTLRFHLWEITLGSEPKDVFKICCRNFVLNIFEKCFIDLDILSTRKSFFPSHRPFFFFFFPRASGRFFFSPSLRPGSKNEVVEK